MKLTKAEVIRLRQLHALESRSDTEEKEYTGLLAKAAKAGEDTKAILADDFDVEKAFSNDEDEVLTTEAVKSLVKESTIEALKGLGIEGDTLANLTKSLDGAKELGTAESIRKAVTDALGNAKIDGKELAKAIDEAFKKHTPKEGVSVKEFNKAIDDLKNELSRSPSKKAFMVEGVVDFPIEHRSGNLSVSQKQLLNTLVKRVGPNDSDSERLAKMNADIPEDILRNAISMGQKNLAALRNQAVYGHKTVTSGSSPGSHFVPTDLSSELFQRMYMNSELAAEFISSEVTMPTPTFVMPIRTTRPTFYVGSENPGSNPNESSPGTANMTLVAAKLIGKTAFSYEADEDSIIPVLPWVAENLASAASDALEGAIINGDTTATHQDSDIHAVSAHYAKLFKGLRKYANAGSLSRSLATGGISSANVLTLKKDMGRWGLRPSDLLIIAGVKGYNDFLGLDETLTAEKVGSNVARILTGEAPNIWGIRILSSSQVREDLTSAGIYDGATTTKGSFLVVHKPSWMMGVHKGFTVEVDRDIQQQLNIVVASFRRDFKPLETPSASLPYVVMGRDYDA